MYNRNFLTSLFLVFSITLFSQGGRIPVPADHGMVVSSHYLASEIGRDILKQGGNAVDASVATAFALAVSLPSAGNIGGGGFMIYQPVNTDATAFNFREKAPLKATREMYLNNEYKIEDNSNHEGALSVGVPGTVAGLYKAHQKYGKLDWSKLVLPAIEIAEKGFPIGPGLAEFSQWVENNQDDYKSTAKVFLKPDGTAMHAGDILIQKDLAETLHRIRDHGAKGFYEGKTARLFADFMFQNNGIISEADLLAYEAEEVEPIKGMYRGFDIIGMPPPGSGGVAIIEMLNILENFDLREAGHNSAKSIHLISEAMRRAFADRAQFLGDPNFNPDMPLDMITSKEYALELSKTIQQNVATKSDSVKFNRAHMAYESPETTHFSVVDMEGNAVSMTYTLEHSYGSKMVVKGAGFLLNNEMGDFNAIPGLTNSQGNIGTKPNQIEPEKRMLSSMSPTIVSRDGKPYIVIGSPGGRRIINTVLQVILNVVDYDLDIAKAIESPKFHHQWLPDITQFEAWGFSPDTIEIYKSFGHAIDTRESQGRAMGILVDPVTGKYYGAADTRSYNGKAAGY